MKWTVEEVIVTALLLLFLTHFYIPVLQPVQSSLFTAASDDQSVLGQFINLLCWATAGAIMLRSLPRLAFRSPALLWTVAFSALPLISVAWSQDPAVTLRKSVFLLLTTAFGIYFSRRYAVEQQMRLICMAGLVASCLSIFFALGMPKFGLDHTAHEGAWMGIFTQKNVCAREMLFLLASLLPYRPVASGLKLCRAVAILTVVIVIIGTQSKTGLLIMAAILLFFPTLAIIRRMSRGMAFVGAIAALTSIGVIGAIAASALPRFIVLIGRDDTMTGRTQIWQAVLQAIMKHPLLGYGFSAFWLSLRGESANIVLALRWAVPAAHNGFLEIWLQLGVTGLVLFAIGFTIALRTALRSSHRQESVSTSWPLAILLLTLIYNLDESSLMQPNDFLWVLYIATLTNLAAQPVHSATSRILARPHRLFVTAS